MVRVMHFIQLITIDKFTSPTSPEITFFKAVLSGNYFWIAVTGGREEEGVRFWFWGADFFRFGGWIGIIGVRVRLGFEF